MLALEAPLYVPKVKLDTWHASTIVVDLQEAQSFGALFRGETTEDGWTIYFEGGEVTGHIPWTRRANGAAVVNGRTCYEIASHPSSVYTYYYIDEDEEMVGKALTYHGLHNGSVPFFQNDLPMTPEEVPLEAKAVITTGLETWPIVMKPGVRWEWGGRNNYILQPAVARIDNVDFVCLEHVTETRRSYTQTFISREGLLLMRRHYRSAPGKSGNQLGTHHCIFRGQPFNLAYAILSNQVLTRV